MVEAVETGAKRTEMLEAGRLDGWIVAARKEVIFYEALTGAAHGADADYAGPYLSAMSAEETLRGVARVIGFEAVGEAEAEFKARLWMRQEIDETRAKGELGDLGGVVEGYLDDPAMAGNAGRRRRDRENASRPNSS